MLERNGLVFSGLCVLMLLSALWVVYRKYRVRQLFNEIQVMERELDNHEVEWGRLQLEISMLTESNRVEIAAKKRLNLVMPQREEIVYIKP